MMDYIFIREDGFYEIELKDDNDAIANALHNVGTIEVQDLQGNIIFKDNR